MSALRVALIGGGGFMGRVHSLACSLAPIGADPPFSVVKELLVDVDADVAAASAQSFGWARSSHDWQAAVTSEDIDVVDIVTPPHTHAAIAELALDHGKHVFCEKPLSNDADEALALARRAHALGLVNQVGFNYRHTPVIAYAKQLVDDGRLGNVLQFRASYLVDVGLHISDFGWRGNRASGGSGVGGDLGSHIIDVAEVICGPIVRVVASLRSFDPEARRWRPEADRVADDRLDDSVSWIAEFASGATGVFTASFHSVGRKNKLHLELDGSLGGVEFDWNANGEIKLAWVDDPAEESGFTTVIANSLHPDVWYPAPGLGVGYIDGSAIQLRKFFTSIVSGTASSPDFLEAAHVQAVVSALSESGRTQAWVDVPRFEEPPS